MENENKKLGSEPAFPFEWDYQMDNSKNPVEGYNLSKGMSKRFYAACAAMQGLIIQKGIRIETYGCIEDDVDEIDTTLIKAAYRIADELLRQEGL